MSEINVTPFVDVMLVLLIIFMVAAPLLTVGVEVNLPETEAEAISEQGEPLTLSITSEGNIFVQDTAIEFDNLVPHLQAVAQAGYDQPIYVRGDEAVAYGEVAKVYGRLSASGFSRITMVTE